MLSNSTRPTCSNYISLVRRKGRGPLSPLGLTSAPAHALRNMDRGPLTFAPKDWVLLLAVYNGLSGGRILPNRTLLDRQTLSRFRIPISPPILPMTTLSAPIRDR